MTEKQADDPSEDAQDQQTATQTWNTAQASTLKSRSFSLAALIIGLVILLLLGLALIFSVISPNVFILISTFGVVLQVVLQLPSTGGHIETAVKNLHNYLDERSQHLANTLGKVWRKRGMISTTLSSLIILSLLLYIFHPFTFLFNAHPTPPKRPQAPIATPIPSSVEQISDGAYIGLSYGLTNFDTKRADSNLKNEAAQSLKENNTNAAKGYWQLAMREDETDAEVCIYQEDQNVLDFSSDYVTLVVVATLTGNDKNAIEVGRSILQGACVAQKEYNDHHKLPNGRLVRLLIANIDDPSLYAYKVAKQIQEAAINDTATFVGVMGQLSNSDNAIQVLSKAHIPMLSATSLYSPVETSYLFSVAPSIQREAEVAAKAATQLSPYVALFYDPANAYSNSLAQALKSQLNTTSIVTNTYTTGQAVDTLPGRINSAMSSTPTPGLIYLAGYPDDASFLVPYVHSRWPNVQVMGGDALYQYVHSFTSARATFNGMHFTSFAFHDEWIGRVAQKPVFFDEYATSFDSEKQHVGNLYGYLLPDSDAILSYDASNVFLKVCSDILTKGKETLTPQAVWQALQNPSHFSGVSGQISFGKDGEPLEKAVVVMEVKPEGTSLIAVQGPYS